MTLILTKENVNISHSAVTSEVQDIVSFALNSLFNYIKAQILFVDKNQIIYNAKLI